MQMDYSASQGKRRWKKFFPTRRSFFVFPRIFSIITVFKNVENCVEKTPAFCAISNSRRKVISESDSCVIVIRSHNCRPLYSPRS